MPAYLKDACRQDQTCMQATPEMHAGEISSACRQDQKCMQAKTEAIKAVIAHIFLQDVLDFAQLVGDLLIPAFAQILVSFASLCHLYAKLEGGFGVGLFGALILCPLLLSVKVIPRAALLLITHKPLMWTTAEPTCDKVQNLSMLARQLQHM